MCKLAVLVNDTVPHVEYTSTKLHYDLLDTQHQISVRVLITRLHGTLS